MSKSWIEIDHHRFSGFGAKCRLISSPAVLGGCDVRAFLQDVTRECTGALLDEVALTGKQVIVTKRGKPVAKVVPVDDQDPPSLLGSVVWEKDLVSPIDEDWDADA